MDDLVLRVAVPVSLHHGSPRTARGNLAGAMAVPIPIGEPDAAQRLHLIAGDTAHRRTKVRPQVFTGILASPLLQRLVVPFVRRQRIVNVYVANVIGPPAPLHLAGARLVEVFPVVPLTGNVTLGIGVLSYAGQLNITAVADRDSWSDLPVFLRGLDSSLKELTHPAVRAL